MKKHGNITDSIYWEYKTELNLPPRHHKVWGRIVNRDRATAYYHLCKGKKKCEEGIDDDRFMKYLDEFAALLDRYRDKQKI